MASNDVSIEFYSGDLEDLIDLFQMAQGLEALDGVRQLIAIEVTRGTRYYAAMRDGKAIGMVGVYFDPTGAVTELEPPQIIDVAVLPAFRRQGVARALIDRAVQETRAAGYDRLWLYTDGNDADMLTFYLRLGFRLISVVPDWFGDGTSKAIFRLDFSSAPTPET